ncbi:MAG: hypothetical protein V1793_06675 [Pseudomonadota bacterium]
MASSKGNRQSLRINHTARFLCTYPDTGKVHEVTMLNYNNDGIYFETVQPIEPGTVVLLYSKGGEFPETVSDMDNREYATMAYAKIRWCRALDKGTGAEFGIGAEYVIV